MDINQISESMGKPLKRGILRGRLFGEIIIEGNDAYIQHDAHYHCHHTSNNEMESNSQAKSIGLKPLRIEDICADLVLSIKNAKISNDLRFDVGLTDDDFDNDEQRERYMKYKKQGRYFYGRTMALFDYKAHSARIFLPESKEIFTIENFVEPGIYWDHIRIISNSNELNNFPTGDILKAYKTNIQKLGLIPLKKRYWEIINKLDKEREEKWKVWDERNRRRELLEVHILKEERKKPIVMTRGDKEDMEAEVKRLKQQLKEQKEELEEKIKESQSSSYSRPTRTRISVICSPGPFWI